MKKTFFIVLGILLFLAGCSLFAPKPFSPIETEYPDSLDSSEILLLLRKRHNEYSHLWARAKISLSGKGMKGKKFFHATLLFQEPDLLRIRGSRMITSTLFEFILHSGNMALIINKQDKWYEGTKTQWEAHPEASLGIDPTILPTSLLVQQDLIRLIKRNHFKQARRARNYHLFLETKPDMSQMAYLVRTKDLLVKEAALYDPEGQMTVRLRILNYEAANGDVLPSKMEAFFPLTGIKADISVKEYKFPSSFDPRVFELVPPKGMQRLPLYELFQSPLEEDNLSR